MSLRTPLGRIRGLGSAGSGTHHWWRQRITAVALVPLTVWFVLSLVMAAGSGYESALAWVRDPLVTGLLLLTLGSLFYHGQLGMQVVIEDYVHHEGLKVASLVLLNFALVLLAVLCALAVLRIAFGS